MNIFFKKILAIDISDSSVEVLQMSKFLGITRVSFLSRLELDKGMVEKGRIKKTEELAAKLKEYLRGVSAKDVALALPDTVVFRHLFRFFGDADIKEGDVIAEVKKSSTIDIDKCHWDFFIQNIDGEKTVFFAAADKKVVDEYKKFLESIGLSPKMFDLNSFCALRATDIGSDEVLVVDLGGRYGSFSVFDGGVLQTTGLVGFGGDNFTEKLAGQLNVSRQQAGIFKMTAGFDVDKEDGKIFLALQEVLQPLITEIKKILNYCEENKKITIKKIILIGGSALIPKLDMYIFENFGIKTEIGRPIAGNLVLDYLRSGNVSGGVDAMFFSVTLGLAQKYLGVKSYADMGVNLLK